MTAYEHRQVLTAISECDRYIAKEDARAADLRPVEIQTRLAFYKAHREKLIGMLAA